MVLVVVLLVVAVIALASRFGTDSRDGRDWAAVDTGRCTARDMVSGTC